MRRRRLPAQDIFEIDDEVAELVDVDEPHHNAPWQNVGRPAQIRRGQTVEVITTELGDAPETVTACLIRREPDKPTIAGGADLNCWLVAQLSFGAGGMVEIVEIDWLNGTMITVPAGSMQIRCRYIEDPANPDDFDNPVNVGVILTLGTRPPAMGALPQARLTTRLGSRLAGSTINVQVPTRATGVRLLTTDPTLYGSFSCGFSVNAKGAGVYYALQPSGADEMPIAAGIRTVRVTNNAAVAAELSLLWSISL